jgi:hypothetical protein
MAAGGNRNVLNCEIGADGRRDWSHGLFDYNDECGLCMSTSLVKLPYNLAEPLSLEGCYASFCPCVVYSQNNQRLRQLWTHGTPLPGGGDRYTVGCSIYALLALNGHAFILLVC